MTIVSYVIPDSGKTLPGSAIIQYKWLHIPILILTAISKVGNKIIELEKNEPVINHLHPKRYTKKYIDDIYIAYVIKTATQPATRPQFIHEEENLDPRIFNGGFFSSITSSTSIDNGTFRFRTVESTIVY